MDRETEFYYDELVELDIATKDEIALVTCINGTSTDTMKDILFAKTGYRSLEQMFGEEEE